MAAVAACPFTMVLHRLVENDASAADLEAFWRHLGLEQCPQCSERLQKMSSFASVATASWRSNTVSYVPRGPEGGGAATDIPGYEILGELGRGGMGVVYKARHVKLNRLVALKMIRGAAGPEEISRFRAEAEAVARLQHPHIVQIHEIGEHQGQPYFTLEYCTGGSLAAQLDGTPLPAADAARIVETLSRAMQAAHQMNIVHRDLKPANVLLAHEGGGTSKAENAASDSSFILHPSSFVLKISDFGLAKKLDDEGQTQTGAVMGTPSYMSPEQAQGKIHAIGPLTDVYALGAILYQLVTGRPPFKAATAWDTVAQVIQQEPVAPSQLQPNIPRDLETICLKCLRKLPGERYASAAELADDLRRFQQGEPIRARPIGAVARLAKWARRRPAVAALTVVSACTVLALVAVAISLTYQSQIAAAYSKLDAAHTEAQDARLQVEQRNTELKGQKATIQGLLYAQDTAEGGRIWQEARVARLGKLLERTRPDKTGGVDLRNFEWHYLNRLHHSELHTFRVPKAVRCAAFGSSGESLALAGDDNKVVFWDIAKGKPFLELTGQKASVKTFALSSANDHVATGGYDGELKLWEIGVPLRDFDLEVEGDRVESVCFSPNGQFLAGVSCASDDGDKKNELTSWLQIWRTSDRKETCCRKIPGIVQAVACRPDGKLLALADFRGKVHFADLPSGNPRGDFQAHKDPFPPNANALAFSPNGKLLATASSDRTVRIWDVAGVPQQPAKLLHTLVGHTHHVMCVAFADDGQRVASGSNDATVRVWDAVQGKRLRVYKGHTAEVFTVAFAKGGKQLVSAGWDNTAKIWDSTARQDARVVTGHTHHLYGVAFTPDSKQFVAVGKDGQVWLRDAATGQIVRQFGQLAKGFRSVAISPDGARILTGGADGLARLWDVAAGKEAFALPGHADEIAGAAFLDNGRIASADSKGAVKIWNLATRKVMHDLRASDVPVLSLACSRDGRYVACGSVDAAVRVWDAASGELLHTLTRHAIHATGVAFSPDSRRLASTSFDGTVIVWDVQTGQRLLELEGHETQVNCIAYSPDGKRLATGGWENIRLWDAATGQETLSVHGHDQAIFSVAFAPDGQRLASVGWDQTVHLWDAPR